MVGAGTTILGIRVAKGLSIGGNCLAHGQLALRERSDQECAQGAFDYGRIRSMTLGSTVESAWRITRDALIRLEHILVEAGNSDEDLVFHVRRSQNEEQIADWDRADLSVKSDKLDS
jgi:hypothetical protein